MDSDLEAIKRVIDAFERSDWREIDVRSGDLRVHLVAGEGPVPPPAPTGAREVPVDTGNPDRPDAGPELGDRPREDAVVSAPEPAGAVPPGAEVVVSPSPGTFWRAPEPGAPPFTEVGRAVDPATTLCIIEVMKLMNHLKAGLAGRVVAIYAENGATVDRGQPLFALAPAGEPEPD